MPKLYWLQCFSYLLTFSTILGTDFETLKHTTGSIFKQQVPFVKYRGINTELRGGV